MCVCNSASMAKQLSSQALRAICRGCAKEVKLPVRCQICSESYHPSCAAITKVQREDATFDACRSCAFAHIKCISAKHTSASASSTGEASTSTVPATLEILNATNTALNTFIASQNMQNQEINTKLDAVLASHAALVVQIEALVSDNRLLANKCKSLEDRIVVIEQSHLSDVKDLRVLNERLQNRLDVLEKKEIGCSLVLSGVPESPQEQLGCVFQQICQCLSVVVDIADIKEISRMKSVVQSTRPRMIFVKLKSISQRNHIIAARRRKQSLYANEVLDSLPKVPVFINEYVQPMTLQLLRETREFAKQRQYRYVWIMNGTVCVRKGDGAPVIKIFRSEEIPVKLQ